MGFAPLLMIVSVLLLVTLRARPGPTAGLADHLRQLPAVLHVAESFLRDHGCRGHVDEDFLVPIISRARLRVVPPHDGHSSGGGLVEVLRTEELAGTVG